MRRRLDAAELADAAVTAALVIGLLTTGRLLAAGTFFQVLGTVVFAVLGARRRVRAVAVATAATMAMAVLLGGVGPVSQAFVAGLFGGSGGAALRRGHGPVRHVLLTVAIGWPIVTTVTLGFLATFADARELSFENGRNQWEGIARILDSVGLEGPASAGTEFVEWSIEHWWVMVPLLQLAITVGYALIVRRLGGAVLRRVDAALGRPWTPPRPPTGPVAPVPVTLGALAVHRDDELQPIAELDTTLEPSDRVSLVGANGTGKTTLLESLAGLHDAAGIGRTGAPGLGRAGGTALIGQAPETQVVGLRVLDDLRWGLDGTDPAALLPHLAAVGLAGREDQPTSQLSGGELQRLAIAAALARQPRLLLSDESTGMLDPAGRAAIVELLTAGVADATVVHSTHHADEIHRFERSIRLPDAAPAVDAFCTSAGAPGELLLSVRDLGYVHDAGSPWARPVFEHVSFELRQRGLVVIRGENGAGKTTLVRLLAGLQTPTTGQILLRGEPLTSPDRRIGVAFQHARLQLLRPTVTEEAGSLAGTDDEPTVARALTTVGLEPASDGRKRLGELSGGQQRRLLLAGLVARRSEVLVLDEPLAGLDRAGRDRLTGIIDRRLAAGTGVVVVSHDPAWALDRADTVVDLVPAPERVP